MMRYFVKARASGASRLRRPDRQRAEAPLADDVAAFRTARCATMARDWRDQAQGGQPDRKDQPHRLRTAPLARARARGDDTMRLLARRLAAAATAMDRR